MALPTQLPSIDENTALFPSTGIMDKGIDLDRISVLEQETERLQSSDGGSSSGQDVQRNLALRQYNIIAHSLRDGGDCVVGWSLSMEQ
jgi:hypothetical protein